MKSDNIVELMQEAEVVLKVKTQVTNLVFQHGHTLHSHAKGKSRILLTINTAGIKDVGVYHAAAQNLQPTGTLADVAALAATNIA